MTNNNNAPLEPCPQCASRDLKTQLKDRQWQIICLNCGHGATQWYKSAQLALDYWNDHAKNKKQQDE